MKRLFFRCDASASIGLGHITRSISLATMLQSQWEITFCSKELPLLSEEHILSSGFNLIKLETEFDFFKLLNGSKIVILDGYNFDIQYQRKVKETNAVLVCIDDLHDSVFLSDLIINHAPLVFPRDYKAQAHTLFALGIPYILLRPLFINSFKNKPDYEKIETILICMGGADPLNITLNALSVVSKMVGINKILVITGPSYIYEDSLISVIENDERILHRKKLNESEMLNCLLDADLAIVPSSGILYETLATGTPAIIGMYTENQKLIYDYFVSKEYIFDGKDLSKVEIEKALELAMVEKRKIGVTDFYDMLQGVKERYLRLFDLFKISAKFKLRPIQISDNDITFKWASNPEIRKSSFSTHEITVEEHSSWFEKKFKDANCLYYIGELEGKEVGSIRFDKIENVLRISYLVDPLFQGLGLGILFLLKGIQEVSLLCRSLNINKIIGEVFKSNIPSIKAFERLGFEARYSENHIVFEKNID
jgi:UDP-2,4-diacetamido-2,4,6-trideoxy-beta-L-altropyranose hydrolase